MKILSYALTSLAIAGTFFIAPVLAAETEEQVPPSEEIIADELTAELPTVAVRTEDGKERGNPLGFTDAQLEKMAALKDQYQVSTAGKKAELKSLMRQMFSELTQPTIDRAKITGIHDKMAALKADLSNARLAYALDRADVLTPDQRKEIHHRMLLHQVGHKRWGHQRGCGGGGHHEWHHHHGHEGGAGSGGGPARGA